MASNDNTDSVVLWSSTLKSEGGKSNTSRSHNAAAAEEEEDTADYDPRQFENPQPDDRDGGGTGKAKIKTKAKTKAKTAKDTSGKAAADGSHCCYHCGTADA